MKYPKGCNMFCGMCWWTCQYHKIHGLYPRCHLCLEDTNYLDQCVLCCRSVCPIVTCSLYCHECYKTVCSKCVLECNDWNCTMVYCPQCQADNEFLAQDDVGDWYCRTHTL